MAILTAGVLATEKEQVLAYVYPGVVVGIDLAARVNKSPANLFYFRC